jgi:hypothetical protein
MPKIEFCCRFPGFENVFASPRPSSKFIPDWYKDMPMRLREDKKDAQIINGDLKHNQTLKQCPPILDYMCGGYTIPLWSDLCVDFGPNHIDFAWIDVSVQNVAFHTEDQLKDSMFEKYMINGKIFKLNSPWYIKVPKGYSCLFMSPWFHESDIEIIPAIVDCDGWHSVHFPFVYKPETFGDKNYLAGMPLVQVIPFKREEWNSEVRAATPKEGEHLNFIQVYFANIYKRFFKSKKTFL